MLLSLQTLSVRPELTSYHGAWAHIYVLVSAEVKLMFSFSLLEVTYIVWRTMDEKVLLEIEQHPELELLFSYFEENYIFGSKS